MPLSALRCFAPDPLVGPFFIAIVVHSPSTPGKGYWRRVRSILLDMMARMEKNKEIFGLPLMFWGLWVTLLILWMGRFVTSFLSMYLVSDMHVSAGVAGTIVSMYGFGGIFGCLCGGALSDRFGRPAMIVIGNLGSAAMLVLLAFIGTT